MPLNSAWFSQAFSLSYLDKEHDFLIVLPWYRAWFPHCPTWIKSMISSVFYLDTEHGFLQLSHHSLHSLFKVSLVWLETHSLKKWCEEQEKNIFFGIEKVYTGIFTNRRQPVVLAFLWTIILLFWPGILMSIYCICNFISQNIPPIGQVHTVHYIVLNVLNWTGKTNYAECLQHIIYKLLAAALQCTTKCTKFFFINL